MADTAKPLIGVHLDLKYQMPRKRYLLDWVRRLPGWGLNTLLIEYEDKFPFAKYPFLRDPEAFTPAELAEFLATARGAGLTVIPLVQTLSHLEFALAHPELAALREGPDIPTQICPSNPAAVAFVQDLLREVLAAHAPDPYFHLGGDETWFLGTCPKCAAWLAKAGKVGVWGTHEQKMTALILGAGKTPILWDDLFWQAPETIRDSGLPRAAIIHSWDYSSTSTANGKMQRRIETYQAAGHRTLAAPCLNWGVMAPRRQHCLANTRAWAEVAQRAGMAGVINTAWACFHLPLPTESLLIAATGAMAQHGPAAADAAWERRFHEQEFGAWVDGLPAALETLGDLWEVKVGDLGRPVTPIPYGYMNMVMHYAGGQEERRKRGAYPLDWAEVDFRAQYQKMLALLRAAPDAAAIVAQAREWRGRYATAIPVLGVFAAQARTHRDEAALLALSAGYKHLAAAVLCHLLAGDGDRAALRRELAAAGPALRGALSPFLEPASVARLLRLWWEPLVAALA